MLKIDLTGKIALITGATGQLGRVMARTLAGCGAKVAIHYMNNEAKAQELLGEITAAGGSAMIVQGDITKEASMVHMKKKSGRTWAIRISSSPTPSCNTTGCPCWSSPHRTTSASSNRVCCRAYFSPKRLYRR